MSWYKDRSFPELKRDMDNGPSEILAVIPNAKELDAVIKAHNDEIREILFLAEQWKEAYNNETRRLKIENTQLKQIIEELEEEKKDRDFRYD